MGVKSLLLCPTLYFPTRVLRVSSTINVSNLKFVVGRGLGSRTGLTFTLKVRFKLTDT